MPHGVSCCGGCATSEWYGRRLVVVDRFFPSTRRCSACHAMGPKMDVSVRQWTCAQCGVCHDRDVNAAVNLRDEGLRLLAVWVRPVRYGPTGRRPERLWSPRKTRRAQLTRAVCVQAAGNEAGSQRQGSKVSCSSLLRRGHKCDALPCSKISAKFTCPGVLTAGQTPGTVLTQFTRVDYTTLGMARGGSPPSYNGSSGTFLPVEGGPVTMATVSFDKATRVYPGSDEARRRRP